MSGSPSTSQPSTASEKTTQNPWGPAQPYLKQGMSEAQRLYTLGSAKYTPWSQVAGFTPEQNAYQQGVQNYTTSSGARDLMNLNSSTINNLMSGANNNVNKVGQQGVNNLAGYIGNNKTLDSADANNRLLYGDTTNPYLQQNVQSALDQLASNFKNNTLPTMRRAAIGNGTYGSSRNELAEGMGAAQLNKQMYDTSAQMYSEDYARTEANRMGALQNNLNQTQNQMGLINQLLSSGQNSVLDRNGLGLSGVQQAIQHPLDMLNAYGSIGDQKYAQSQAQLNDSTNRWNFDQNANWENLLKYNQLINPWASLGGSGSANSIYSPNGNGSSTAGNAVGAGLAAIGTAASLFGN